jgi:hypothetical protein
MTGDAVRQVCEAMWPPEEIDRLCQQVGVVERQRQLHLGRLVRAMVISAGTPGGASQADVLRSYRECAVPPVARSACSRWFDAPWEPCMAALAERALAYARAQQVDRSGPLCGVTDWAIVDATTGRGRDALRQEVPGTGDYAALKGPTVRLVGGGAPVSSQVRPAREPESRQLQIDASWRGYGLLADLADASLARRRACEAHGVRFVMRRQEHGTPKVDSSARGQITPAFMPGSDCDALLADDTLVLDGRTMDADVPGGRGRHALRRRRVGVQSPNGSGVCLTNLPPRIGPRPVADLDRGRGEGEVSRRLAQSITRREASDAEQPGTLKPLWHAALIASSMAALLAHTHHVHTRPPQLGAPRTAAPLHPRRLALQRAVPCHSIAQAFELQAAEATARWHKMAAVLTQSGKDPNWRRRPSGLDQLRGWKRQPLARKKPNSGDVSRGHVKAAA